MIHFLKKYILTILLITVITILSVINLNNFDVQPTFSWMDKVVHFIMYGALSFIIVFDLLRDKYFFYKSHNPTASYNISMYHSKLRNY